eukprot:gi/632984394/ref/XP_007909117.1/ PREDICTED: probable G-protein coupled receptor 139 [Callorhinchus milii]
MAILSRGRCGLSKCITNYLVAMAAADFFVLLVDVILNRIGGLYFPNSFLYITPVCTIKVALIYVTTDGSVWLTVAFTLDRFIAICCPNLKVKYCHERTAAFVITTVCLLSGVKNIPWLFVQEPIYINNNIPWMCQLMANFYTSLAWAAFEWFQVILTPLLPFCLIVLLNALTMRSILLANRVRRVLRGQSRGENQKDPEIETRKRSIVLLFTITGCFVFLWLTQVVFFFYWRITKTYTYTGPEDPVYITQESAYLLQLLGTCTNTCIYAVTQSFQHHDYGYKEPFASDGRPNALNSRRSGSMPPQEVDPRPATSHVSKRFPGFEPRGKGADHKHVCSGPVTAQLRRCVSPAEALCKPSYVAVSAQLRPYDSPAQPLGQPISGPVSAQLSPVSAQLRPCVSPAQTL